MSLCKLHAHRIEYKIQEHIIIAQNSGEEKLGQTINCEVLVRKILLNLQQFKHLNVDSVKLSESELSITFHN